MTKAELDKKRSSTLYMNEILYVEYKGELGFPKGVLEVRPRFARHSGLPYPQPKWIACDYYIEDLDGDNFKIANDRYGELYKGFEWVR